MDNPEKLVSLGTQYDKQNKNKTKSTTQCVFDKTQTNTTNVNKTRVLLQTTGGRDEPNIVFMM
jgi:hypothetical protein